MKQRILSILNEIRVPYLILIVWLVIIFQVSAPWKNRIVINNDTVVYYEYLPAFFIFKDPTFKFASKLPENFHGRIWLNVSPNGGKYPKTTMGLSILYTPFFLAGHIAAKFMNYTADGYTLPYTFCMSFSGLFYAFLGLLILDKILRRFFLPWITALVLITFCFSTNLYYYTVYDGPLAHAHDFFLISLFIYLCIKWHENTSYLNSILLGFVFGFIFLVRPVNALVILIPLLYNINGFNSILPKLKFIVDNYLKIIVAGIFALAAIFPQLLFWKHNTGNWLVWSYENETFYWTNPHLIEGLFSYRSGWLLYTPVMFFAIIGLFFLKKYCNEMKWAVCIFFCLNIYIIFSWWCWWYGGFSIRAMVDTYGILALPLGAFYAETMKRKYLGFIVYPLLAFFIYMNIFQTDQFTKLYVHYSHTTRASYWDAFLKDIPGPNYWDLLREPNHEAAASGKDEPQGVECFP